MPVFEAVNAAEGDMILLRFESPRGRPRLWLIDGGPKASDRAGERFFPFTDALLPRLAELREAAGTDKTVLDLVVCTHIDDDHINGIERMLRCKADPESCGSVENRKVRDAPIDINEVWFNSFSALLGAKAAARSFDNAPADAAIVVAVNQGDELTKHLMQLSLSDNTRFAGLHPGFNGLVMAYTKPIKVNGLDVTILAPGQQELEELRKEWVKKSRVVSTVPQDLAPESRLDDSVANLSSIVMLVEFPSPDGGPRRVLLTGDARGDHVARGYRATGGPIPLPIDVMKVPHHGAVANMHKSLLETFPAHHYVFSANGKHENPDPPVVEALVRICARDRSINLHFTNEVVWSKPYRMESGETVQSLREMKTAFDVDPILGPHINWIFRRSGNYSIDIEF